MNVSVIKNSMLENSCTMCRCSGCSVSNESTQTKVTYLLVTQSHLRIIQVWTKLNKILAGKPLSFTNPENEFFTKSTGDYVHLKCFASGWPSSIITWFKGDDPIVALPNFENFKLLDNNKVLKIFLNDSASFGQYVCKAENQYDVIEKHFDVMRYGIFIIYWTTLKLEMFQCFIEFNF